MKPTYHVLCSEYMCSLITNEFPFVCHSVGGVLELGRGVRLRPELDRRQRQPRHWRQQHDDVGHHGRHEAPAVPTDHCRCAFVLLLMRGTSSRSIGLIVLLLSCLGLILLLFELSRAHFVALGLSGVLPVPPCTFAVHCSTIPTFWCPV